MESLSVNIRKRQPNEEAIQKLITAQHAKKLDEAYNRALEVQYDLNESDFDTVANIFAPRVITVAANARVHPHPVPAILQNYAYSESREYAKNFRNSVDIGGTPLRTPRNHHICAKVAGTLRTSARYLNAALIHRGHGHKGFIDHALYNTPYTCGKGAELCKVIGEYAYMINVYDVPIETIPLIMSQHKTVVLDVWMFLPNCLYDPKFKSDETFYKCNYIPTKGTNWWEAGLLRPRMKTDKIQFALLDQSAVYEHSYTEWRKYMFTTSLNAGDHSIFVEHIGNKLHTFQRIRFTRVEDVDNRLYYRQLTLPNDYGMIMVPNVLTYLKQGHYDNMYRYCYIADHRFVNDAYKYWNRQPDHGFNASNFYSYMDGKSASVYYQAGGTNTFVYRGVDQQNKDYVGLLTSLYILGMLSRERQTKFIGKFINISQKEDGTLVDRIVHAIRKKLYKVKEETSKFIRQETDYDYEQRIQTIDETYIKNLEVKKIEMPIVGKIITLNYHYGRRGYTSITCHETPDDVKDVERCKPPFIEDIEIRTDDYVESTSGCLTQKLIFDPPSDGACGRHAIEYFTGKTDDNDTWHNADQLGQLAKSKGWNLIAHHGRTVTKYQHHRFAPTCRVSLQGSHWIAVNCECSFYNYYIGAYKDIPINNANTYINCANEKCTDSAGQAADFAHMFPAYKEKLSLPIDKCQHVKHIGYNLIIAVANNERANKDKKRTKEHYNTIAKIINENVHGAIYLPMIGTSIFGCDLCCFKAMCMQLHDSIPIIMCFFDDKQRVLFDNTRLCTHGGYNKIFATSNPTFISGGYDPKDYDWITPNKSSDHMKTKFTDLEKWIIDNKPNIQHIVDIASAPGAFVSAKHVIKYTPMHYIGPGNFRKNHAYPAEEWMTEKVLNLKLDRLLDQTTCILWDCPISYNYNLHTSMLEKVRKLDCLYITKSNDYDKTTDKTNYTGIEVTVIRNEGSSDSSSEWYMICSKTSTIDVPIIVQIGEISKEIDKIVLAKQDSKICTCKNSLVLPPDDIEFTITKNLLDNFILYMKDDIICQKEQAVYEFIKSAKITGYYKIPVNNGIAGSRKTRNILVNSCSACTIIIAPYRRIVEDINATTCNAAITYIKALKLLMRRKYKQVVIDEIYSTNPIFIGLYQYLQPHAQIIAMGDPYQIPCRDFENCMPQIKINMANYNTVSYRIIPAVASLLNSSGFNCSTKNNVGDNRIVGISGDIASKFKPVCKDYVIICHTQDMKTNLTKIFPDNQIITSAESQGKTYKNVAIYCDDAFTLTSDIHSYIYVALSRSEQKIYLLTESDSIKRYLDELHKLINMVPNPVAKPPRCEPTTFESDSPVYDIRTVHASKFDPEDLVRGLQEPDRLMVDEHQIINKRQNNNISTLIINGDHVINDHTSGTAVERAMEFAGVISASDVATKQTEKERDTAEPLRVYTKEQVDITAVEDILRKIFRPTNEGFGIVTVSYVTNILRENKSGLKMSIDQRAIETRDVQIQGARMCNAQFVVQQCGKSTGQTLDCILERYMAAPNAQRKQTANLYLEGLSKWVSVEFFNQKQQTSTTLYHSTLHYLKNLQTKISLNGKRAEDIRRSSEKLRYTRESKIPLSDDEFKKIKFEGRKIIEAPNKIMVGRYLIAINDKTKMHSDEHVKSVIVSDKDIFDTIDSFCENPDNIKSVIDCISDKNISAASVEESISVIQQRLDTLLARDYTEDSHSMKAYRELAMEWYEPMQSNINFHLKNQPKEIRKDGYDTTNKVGQGVSAWSKMLNCILASIENAFEGEFSNAVNSNVLLALDRSDKDLSHWFKPYLHLYNDRTIVKTDADHTQFDCTQGPGLAVLQSIVYKRCGFPEATVDWLLHMRSSYHANALDTQNNARIRFDFKWQMTSGALYTLWWNTVANMAITGACYDFGIIHLAAFKGDDVHILSSTCKPRKINERAYTDVLGHKIKIQHPDISEFLANIITPHGFFPDVVRRASRVASRIYTHIEDWREIQLSIADALSVVSNETISLSAQIAAYHYQERGYNISPEEIFTLINFLKACTHDNKMRPRFQRKFIVECLTLKAF